jgi:hypothetical protein
VSQPPRCDYRDPAPLLALFPGLDNVRIAERLGVHRMNVWHWRNGRFMRERSAEACAARLGLHPLNIWPDEVEQ